MPSIVFEFAGKQQQLDISGCYALALLPCLHGASLVMCHSGGFCRNLRMHLLNVCILLLHLAQSIPTHSLLLCSLGWRTVLYQMVSCILGTSNVCASCHDIVHDDNMGYVS